MIFISSYNKKYLAFSIQSKISSAIKLGFSNCLMQKKPKIHISRLNKYGQYYQFSTSQQTYQINDYYQLLGVPNTASQEEIKKAYFKKAKDLHPDAQGYIEDEQKQKSQYQQQISENFKRITDAYNTLKDPNSRQKYDYDNFIFRQHEEDLQKGKYHQSRGYYQHQTRNTYTYDWYKDQYRQEGNDYVYGQYGYNNNHSYNKARYSEANREFYRDYDNFYNSSNYQTKQSYDAQINKEPTWKRWKLHWIATISLFIIFDMVRDSYIDRIEMMTEKELDQKIQNMKEQQKGLYKQKDAEVRRDNFLLSKQSTVNDPIFVQEKRRLQFEKELADQQVKIEVSYIDTANQNPYAANKDKVRKFRTSQDFYSGQNALLEFAKNEKMKIEKTPEAEMKKKKMEKPRRGTLLEVAQLADDEYI